MMYAPIIKRAIAATQFNQSGALIGKKLYPIATRATPNAISALLMVKHLLTLGY